MWGGGRRRCCDETGPTGLSSSRRVTSSWTVPFLRDWRGSSQGRMRTSLASPGEQEGSKFREDETDLESFAGTLP